MGFKSFEFAKKYVKIHGYPLIDMRLPAVKNKKFKVSINEHKIGDVLDVVDLRMSFLTGLKVIKLKLDVDIKIHKLNESGFGMWMSTHPIETFTHIYPAMKAHGKVLIGGLGLGYVVRLIQELNTNDINHIWVVEQDKQLISLLINYYPNIRIIHDDIHNYLSTTKENFDYIYLDTWTSTGEWEFLNNVLPLRRLAKRISPNVNCWMEEVMRGQFITGIQTMSLVGKLMWIYDNMDKYRKVNPIGADFFSKNPQLKIAKMTPDQLYKKAEKFVMEYK